MVKLVTVGFVASLFAIAAAQAQDGGEEPPFFGPSADACTPEGSDCRKFINRTTNCGEQQQQLNWTEEQYNQCICDEANLRWIAGCNQCLTTTAGIDQEAITLIQEISESSVETCAPFVGGGGSSSAPAAGSSSVATGDSPSSSGSGTQTSTSATSTRTSDGTGISDSASPPSGTATPPDSAAGDNGVKFGVLGLALAAAGLAVGL
ncbi:hypothetical protein OIO90_000395 [Microbotryomycetes sp. JL221]|nr:hypothetical protein OIO90_000395 [Microbotryomycetes sp. JL221]